VIRTGDALDGETLDLDPGMDVSGKISSVASKKGGFQDLKLKLKYVRSSGPLECTYTIKGSSGGFDINQDDCVTPEEKENAPAP
jgi:hypothetical protein